MGVHVDEGRENHAAVEIDAGELARAGRRDLADASVVDKEIDENATFPVLAGDVERRREQGVGNAGVGQRVARRRRYGQGPHARSRKG